MEPKQSERREIVLPQAEPALEWIMGRALQKVNAQRSHALVRAAFLVRFHPWAQARGDVGTEWRFRLGLPSETLSPLVPDIAYLSYRRTGSMRNEELDSPCIAPDVAVYAHSLHEPRELLEQKIKLYLAAGSDLVVILNVTERTVAAHARSGRRIYRSGEIFAHEALPDFEMQVSDVFDVLKRPRSSQRPKLS